MADFMEWRLLSSVEVLVRLGEHCNLTTIESREKRRQLHLHILLRFVSFDSCEESEHISDKHPPVLYTRKGRKWPDGKWFSCIEIGFLQKSMKVWERECAWENSFSPSHAFYSCNLVFSSSLWMLSVLLFALWLTHTTMSLLESSMHCYWRKINLVTGKEKTERENLFTFPSASRFPLSLSSKAISSDFLIHDPSLSHTNTPIEVSSPGLESWWREKHVLPQEGQVVMNVLWKGKV